MKNNPADIRVVVTGSEGHIGSNVCRFLKDKGVKVLELDVVNGAHQDLSDYSAGWYWTIREFKPDVVFHLAGKIRVDESNRRPCLYYEHNVVATKNLLDAMVLSRCKNIVFASSAAVYRTSSDKLTETDPIEPESTYGETKYICERMIKSYCKGHNMKSVCLRFFNAAGYKPREELFHLIPIVCSRLHHGKAVSIFGCDWETRDGTCIRDYIHVDDIAIAMLNSYHHIKDKEESYSISINIGSSKGHSVLEVYEKCCQIYKETHKDHITAVSYKERRQGDCASLVADCSLAKDLIKFEPTKNLEEMIRDTMKHF